MPRRDYHVEVGRVVEINYGPQAGRLAVIVDIVDQARALIDGPAVATGVERQTIPFKRLSLTSIVVPIQKSVKSSTLYKAFQAADVKSQWEKTNWYKKAQKQRIRNNLTDFDRFKVVVLKKQRNQAIRKEFNKLKKQNTKTKAK